VSFLRIAAQRAPFSVGLAFALGCTASDRVGGTARPAQLAPSALTQRSDASQTATAAESNPAAPSPAQPGAALAAGADAAPSASTPTRANQPQPAAKEGAAGAQAPTRPLREPPAADVAELQRRVIEHVERGEWALARALIDDVLTAPAIAEARQLLEAQRPEEALATVEPLLSAAPGEPRTLLLHGEACLQSGLRARDVANLERALDSFLRAGQGAAARLGASRAARALARANEAAQFAREGWAAWNLAPELEGRQSEAPEVTLAEGLWLEWRNSAVESGATLSEQARGLAEETLQALERSAQLSDAPSRAWLRVAELQQRLGRGEEQLRTLEAALRREPANEALTQQFAQAAQALGGWPAALSALERMRAALPQSAELWRASAAARVELALEPAPESAPRTAAATRIAQLKLADSEFERWGALAPTQRDAVLRERARTRAASGWAQLSEDNVDAAVAEFRSVQALAPGAGHWEFDARIPTALAGLDECARRLRLRGALAEAARLWSDLHRASPESFEWAVLAGRTWRSAAEQELLLSKDLKSAADGRISDPVALDNLRSRARISAKPRHGLGWTLALQRAATEAKERSGKWFKSSYLAFVDAAQLAPNDVRVLCDASEVAVYELRQDLKIVREFLSEAIRLGDLRSKDPQLVGAERRALLEAWGDAHECLGVLMLEHKREPAKAKQHFRLSLEIGPDPRPIVLETYLPQCEEALKSVIR
jgi:transcriptional regulator with XRE-family HTH domain